MVCIYKIDNSIIIKRKKQELKLVLGKQNERMSILTIKIRVERSLKGDCKTLTIKQKFK